MRHGGCAKPDAAALETSDVAAATGREPRSRNARPCRNPRAQWRTRGTHRSRPGSGPLDRRPRPRCHAGPRSMSVSNRSTLVLTLALAAAQWIVPSAARAQTPRIRVAFRLRDAEYRQAFSDAERRTVEDSATALLVQALLRHFRFVSFTADSTDATPRVLLVTLDQKDRGPSAPLGEVGLHVLLRNPPDSTISYWTPYRRAGADLDREAVTVETFLAELGRRRSAAADAVGAETYWQMGLRIAEAFPEAPVMLDLAMETAALYQRHRELDPDGRKFRDIEQRLFDQKSEAYARADKDAIQQLHTVLGLIYVERGIWQSNLPWTNATYQLEHALSTARERDAA